MHSSEYLFNKPRSSYEPMQTELANKKIADAMYVKKSIAAEKELHTYEYINEVLIPRYQAVEEAIRFWEKIKTM